MSCRRGQEGFSDSCHGNDSLHARWKGCLFIDQMFEGALL